MVINTLAGRRIIITGASRGIGAAIAHRFATEGAKCTLIGRSQRTLEELSAALLRDKFVEPNPHRIAVGDVSDRSFWARLTVAEVSEQAHTHTLLSSFSSNVGGNLVNTLLFFELLEGCRCARECGRGDAL
jgi:NAD(P)-dependent dehydrogenase (short-subunit alcohol dehydrogenase family)